MTTRQRSDGLGSHDAQNHVRYVEVYAIYPSGDQPVEVKALVWNGSEYATYGDSFRIGDANLALIVTVGQRLWVTRRRDSLRWEPLTVGNEDRKVASGPTDTGPSTLIQKLYNVGTYDSETELFVKFEEFDDGGTRKVRAMYVPGSGGGGSTPEKRLVAGVAYSRVFQGDAFFEIVGLGRLAGGVLPAEPLLVHNFKLRNYQPGTSIVAVWDNTQEVWHDITPASGQRLAVLIPQDIPAAVWNAVAKTLTPALFNAYWLQRDDPAAPGESLFVGGSPAQIQCENQSQDSFVITSSGKALIGWVEYQEGMYVLDSVDCQEVSFSTG